MSSQYSGPVVLQPEPERGVVGVEDREEEVLEREEEVDRKLPPSLACAHRRPPVASGVFCSDQADVYPCISGRLWRPEMKMASLDSVRVRNFEIFAKSSEAVTHSTR